MALTIKIRGDATHFSKTIAGVKVEASGLTGVMGKLATSQLAFGAALSAAAAGAVALGAGLAFIKDASGKAAGMESLQVQFEVLTKSAEGASAMIKDFREEAMKSPLSVTDYAQAGKTLMAFGVSADKTLPILRMLGDVSMGNAEQFGSLALAFAQTQAAGRLMGQEVLQFVNAGFNPLQEISRKTGKSMVELKKAMEDGAISADMVTDAFRSATEQGGLFYGALDKGAATTEGKIAKLGDAILGLKVSFGTGFNEGLKVALDAASNAIPQLEGKFQELGVFFGEAIRGAINEDYALFEKIGVVIGEAALAGFMTVAEQIGPRMIERFGDSLSVPILPGSGFATEIGKKITRDKAQPIAQDWEQNSGKLKDALSDLVRTYDEKTAPSKTNEDIAKTRTATEKLVMLYQNAEARRQRGIMFSR